MSWLPASGGVLASHGLAFVGGLLSSLSPCVLPTVFLVVAYVGGYGKGRGRAFLLSLGFVLGLSATLAVSGFVAAIAGNLLTGSGAMAFIASGLCLLMGLVLLEVVPVSLPGLTLNPKRKRSGFFGAFLLGIPFAFVSSPCTAPVTVAVLSYAASRAIPALGLSLLFAYGLGRSLPLLAAGVLSGTASSLAVSDTWSTRLRRVSGVVLLGVGVYLLWQAL